MSAELGFVDTNVPAYVFDDDSTGKQETARQLFDHSAGRIVLSTQVLGEFYVTVTRKLARPPGPGSSHRGVGCALCASGPWPGTGAGPISR